jgi:hypothetical protein
MDTKFQSSFIPKQPVNQVTRHVSGSNIFFLISFLIFIVTGVLSGFVYLWDKQTDIKITQVNKDLNSVRNAFDQNTVKEFVRLNDKINTSDFLLKQHVAPSVLFGIIGDSTLKNVRFTNFTYANTGGDKVSVSMSGEAISYETVSLQASAFANPELRNVFRNSIFSDPSLAADGKATFTYTAGIDPTLINYYKLITDPNNQIFSAAGLSSKKRGPYSGLASSSSAIDTYKAGDQLQNGSSSVDVNQNQNVTGQ